MRLERLLRPWQRHLQATNKTAGTIGKYLAVARQFSASLDPDHEVADLRRRDVEGYLATVLETRKASTAMTHFQALRQLFKWLEDEGEVTTNPFLKLTPPIVPEAPVPVLTVATIKRLLIVCGNHRRDAAIIRLFLDTGIRLSELTALAVDDVDLLQDTVTVMGKGRRVRVVPFGDNTARALDRWLRIKEDRPEMWTGRKGAMTRFGIGQMVSRRGSEAGIGPIHPHQFRHTFAHNWLSNGGSETDLMRLMGWRSRSMLQRYGASAADERAVSAFKKLALGERY